MGWFAIACVVGFLLYWSLRPLAVRDGRPQPYFVGAAAGWLERVTRCDVRDTGPAFVTIVLLLVLLLWAWTFGGANSFHELGDTLARGYVGRFIFGLILGFGTAYILIEQRWSPEKKLKAGGDTALEGAAAVALADVNNAAAGDAGAQPQNAKASKEEGNSGGLSANTLLMVGATLIVLGLVAPHIDRWLSNLQSLKSPLIELQVTSLTTHKIAVAEGIEALNDAQSLVSLAGYANRIRQDIEYMEEYGDEDPIQKQRVVKASKELLGVFEHLISPVANCVKVAIGNGMSLDEIRQHVRPMASNVARIVFRPKSQALGTGSGSQALGTNQQGIDREHQAFLQQQHTEFWQRLLQLPEQVRFYLRTKLPDSSIVDIEDDCRLHPEKYLLESEIVGGDSFPKLQDYEFVPYLIVAVSRFMSFMNLDELALRILREGEAKLEMQDYSFLFLMGQLTYYQGRPVELRQSYLGYFSKMKETAQRHLAILDRALDNCSDAACKAKVNKLRTREQAAALYAVNNLGYYLAEDLARGSPHAARHSALAYDLAMQLKTVIDAKSDPKNEWGLKDTYAYIMLVLEARKSNPDREKIKDLVRIFEQVVENLESDIAKQSSFDKLDLTLLKITRTHLTSARELGGE